MSLYLGSRHFGRDKIVGPLGAAYRINLEITKRTDLEYFYNTHNVLLMHMNIITLWTIQCESFQLQMGL